MFSFPLTDSVNEVFELARAYLRRSTKFAFTAF